MRLNYHDDDQEDNNPDPFSNMTFATTTPADFAIDSSFGYTTNGRNFPGLLSITFLPSTTIAGYSITNQSSLLAISFPNLTSFPTGALSAFSGNTVLTSWSADVCTSVAGLLSFSGNTLMTAVTAPLLASAGGINFNACAALAGLNLPALTTLTGTLTLTGTALVSFSLPALTTATAITATSVTTMTSFSLASLTTMSGGLTVTGATALTSVTLTNYLPFNTQVINFSGCALTAASVNHILARAVANAAYVSGTINLSGGTSSAPTGQGLTDKATLQGRGVTVTTN